MSDLPMPLAEHIHRFCTGIAEGIRKAVQAIADWFNSPQVRRFFRHLAVAARKAGIVSVSKVPARRKAVSTKRARIYQRKMQGDLRKAMS